MSLAAAALTSVFFFRAILFREALNALVVKTLDARRTAHFPCHVLKDSANEDRLCGWFVHSHANQVSPWITPTKVPLNNKDGHGKVTPLVIPKSFYTGQSFNGVLR
jgi:hypothetical protein